MFTGIVEEIGSISRVQDADGGLGLEILARTVLTDVHIGDSISVNGTCLTVTAFTDSQFNVGLAPETLERTNLGELVPESTVNLERSLAADGRFGGHIVQGHVDTTARTVARTEDGNSLRLTFELGPAHTKYIVEKGYIAIDGISLTVVSVWEDGFSVMLIDHTLNHVTLGRQPLGYLANIEVDILGKYIERLGLAETLNG